MKRDYITGLSENANFFIGNEVEHTPAFGKLTLFVTGIQPVDKIKENLLLYNSCEHIFFGANHSYNPKEYVEQKAWETMIFHFLDQDYLCSLDIPVNQIETFNESGLCERNNFIPQIRISIPYIHLWNYNTMLKIDDKDFKATNPGVWSHSLHSLMDRNKFTDWSQYKNDKVLA